MFELDVSRTHAGRGDNRGEICVNDTTVIKYLLPGSTTTDAGVLGPVTLGSAALFLAVLITVTPWWPIGTTLAITLRPASGGWSRWADRLFVGGRDDFCWEVQPNRTYQRQITQVVDRRDGHTIRGGIRRPLE